MPVVVARQQSSPYCGGPVYFIVVLLVIFVVLSTFVSLQLHEAQGPHVLHEGGKIQQLALRKPILEAIDAYTSMLSHKLVQAAAHAPAPVAPTPQPPKAKAAACPPLTFPAKCPIHPLVHYWDSKSECNESPLRVHNGLSAAPEHRRYVVFQPDLGGWNNIRMALEVVIVLAKVTGRILVLPPGAYLYLLVLNRKSGQNKSGMEDYFDFSRLRAGNGLETITMEEFLATVALPGDLSLPLPGNNTKLAKAPLWAYLEKACEPRLWQPGKAYIGFNLTSHGSPYITADSKDGHEHLGDFSSTDSQRIEEFSLKGVRKLWPYDASLHVQKALYFPGHEDNRLLTHFYSYLFFAEQAEDHKIKRFVRDRLRYHDEIFCVASRIIEKLLLGQADAVNASLAHPVAGSTDAIDAQYIAFHIRRGDFQQKHTRLPAEEIVQLTNALVPDRAQRIAYISTDEGNRSFFAPFFREYRAVYFLSDLQAGSGIEKVNQNFVGMIEQVVCAGAHTFIGTPLSTFTAYITRMRGYLNRTISVEQEGRTPQLMDRRGIYERTFYYMKHHMHQLHTKPKVHFPLWIRDFVEVFKDIDDL